MKLPLHLPIVKIQVTETDDDVILAVRTKGNVTSNVHPIGRMDVNKYEKFIQDEYRRINQFNLEICPYCLASMVEEDD